MPNIKHRTYIKVTPEKVYRTLTTGQGWNAWFTDDTTVEMNQDGTGEIRLRWKNFGVQKQDIVDGGPILKAKPNECFVFEWSPGEGATTVAFSLKEYRDGTRVQLEESGYSMSASDLGACIGCAAGWGEALTLLKIYLEHGIVCKEDLLG